MLRIAICDDNEQDLEMIERLTISSLQTWKLEYQIMKYQNGTDLLQYLGTFNLIFLDIVMEGKNGIEIAHEIRKTDKNVKIIFISKSSKYLQAGYKVHAERYLLKPLNSTEFETELNAVFAENVPYEHIYLNDSRLITKIRISEIHYIECINRKTILHSLSASQYSSIPLKEWLQLLPSEYFIQIHKSFIVNMDMIDYRNGSSITMKNGDVLPLGRTYQGTFQNGYHVFSNKFAK